MLHETGSSPDYVPPEIIPPLESESDLAARLQKNIYKLVSEVFDIDHEFHVDEDDLATEDRALLLKDRNQVLVSFRGQLRIDAETAYDQLSHWLAASNLTPLFREARVPVGDRQYKRMQVIHIITGRFNPPRAGKPWLNLALLVATFFSVLLTGTSIAVGQSGVNDPLLAQQVMDNMILNMWRGLPYAISILLILGTHEMGHYLMMVRRGVPASLPFFIPVPFISPFGTFGAAIALRGPIKDRKTLFDIGAAGPLAGLVFAVPILLIGLATSPVTQPTGGLVEGNSILYAMSKFVIFGEFLPNGTVDVLVNQLAWAGWTGLFVTALNLIPLGQLDGGHILYATLGETARRLYYPLLGVMLLMMFFVSDVWLMLFVLLFLFGRYYAIPLNNITRLDKNRRNLALVTFGIFLLIFVPIPLSIVGEPTGGFFTGTLNLPVLGMVITAGLFTLRQRLGRAA